MAEDRGMNRSAVGTLGILGVAFVGIGTFALFTACGFSPPDRNPNPSTGGGACSAPPGQLPAPDCDNSTETCTGGGCQIESKCGSPQTCLPLSDNSGKSTLDFRMRRLNVAAPKALAQTFVQNTVVTANIDLKGTVGAPTCGDEGQGAFNWLLEVDKNANTLKTGGAIPADPFSTGYCFYNHIPPGGTSSVGPTTLTIHFDSSGGTFDTDPTPKLPVPIFLNGDINSVIVLPLSNVVMQKVSITNDGNCIGSFQLAALDNTCAAIDESQCEKWKTAGALGGFITLEDADGVNIDILQESLCILLTGGDRTANGGKCPRDGSGKIDAKGDFCSTSNTPGDCQDSYWLAATFAASAVKVNDGSSTPECQGGGEPVDAGSDAGSDLDAADQ